MALRDGRVGTEVALETPLALVSLLVDLEATNPVRHIMRISKVDKVFPKSIF